MSLGNRRAEGHSTHLEERDLSRRRGVEGERGVAAAASSGKACGARYCCGRRRGCGAALCRQRATWSRIAVGVVCRSGAACSRVSCFRTYQLQQLSASTSLWPVYLGNAADLQSCALLYKAVRPLDAMTACSNNQATGRMVQRCGSTGQHLEKEGGMRSGGMKNTAAGSCAAAEVPNGSCIGRSNY